MGRAYGKYNLARWKATHSAAAARAIGKIEAKLETDEEIAMAYLQLKPGTAESIAFVEKHKAALWRINSKK